MSTDPYARIRVKLALEPDDTEVMYDAVCVRVTELRALLKERDELEGDLAYARDSICETGIASAGDPLWMSAAAYRIRKLTTEARPKVSQNPDKSPE